MKKRLLLLAMLVMAGVVFLVVQSQNAIIRQPEVTFTGHTTNAVGQAGWTFRVFNPNSHEVTVETHQLARLPSGEWTYLMDAQVYRYVGPKKVKPDFFVPDVSRGDSGAKFFFSIVPQRKEMSTFRVAQFRAARALQNIVGYKPQLRFVTNEVVEIPVTRPAQSESNRSADERVYIP